jgi:Holliday junction DNA helicase RuvB
MGDGALRAFHSLDLFMMISLESKLRLSMHYSDIIGQEDSIARLSAFSDFYRKNGSTTEHILIVGDEGTGKRTIAVALADELGVPWQEVSASQLEIRGDFSAIVTNLRPNEVLMIHDVHRLRRVVQDILLEVLRTNALTIEIGQGPSARRHVMDVRPFTLVGTAPKKSECPEELLSNFALVLPLQAYTNSALEKIGEKIASQEKIEIDVAAIRLLVANSRSRPDKLKMLMQRVARALNKPRITEGDALQALAVFGITARMDIHTDDHTNPERMSGVEFEKFVMTLLSRMEFRPEMTKATGDGGIDIVAVLDKPILGGRYLFQCKRYAPENLIGASTVRDFYGAVTADKAVKGILITTSDFTAQAREFAERVGLELINLPQLQSLLAQYGMASDSTLPSL